MPFYPIAPDALRDLYLSLAAKHNDPATPEHEREIARWKGYGVIEATTALYGPTTAGMLATDADLALPEDDRPACGGFYLNVEVAEALAEVVAGAKRAEAA